MLINYSYAMDVPIKLGVSIVKRVVLCFGRSRHYRSKIIPQLISKMLIKIGIAMTNCNILLVL